MLLLLLTSCGLPQAAIETANRLQDTRIEITDDICVTKNGVDIGKVNINPTRMRVPVVGTPTYYGITLTYTF